MIIKSTPVSPKRNRVTTHASGTLFPLGNTGAVLEFTNDPDRLHYVDFDERDLPALKKIVTFLEKSKEKKRG